MCAAGRSEEGGVGQREAQKARQSGHAETYIEPELPMRVQSQTTLERIELNWSSRELRTGERARWEGEVARSHHGSAVGQQLTLGNPRRASRSFSIGAPLIPCQCGRELSFQGVDAQLESLHH